MVLVESVPGCKLATVVVNRQSTPTSEAQFFDVNSTTSLDQYGCFMSCGCTMFLSTTRPRARLRDRTTSRTIMTTTATSNTTPATPMNATSPIASAALKKRCRTPRLRGCLNGFEFLTTKLNFFHVATSRIRKFREIHPSPLLSRCDFFPSCCSRVSFRSCSFVGVVVGRRPQRPLLCLAASDSKLCEPSKTVGCQVSH